MFLLDDTTASGLEFIDLGVVELVLGRDPRIADQPAGQGRGDRIG